VTRRHEDETASTLAALAPLQAAGRSFGAALHD
jgi:hypothetical protein